MMRVAGEIRHFTNSNQPQYGRVIPSHRKIMKRLDGHRGRNNQRTVRSNPKPKQSLPRPKSRRASFFGEPEQLHFNIEGVEGIAYVHGWNTCQLEIAMVSDEYRDLVGWQSPSWFGKGAHARAYEQLQQAVTAKVNALKVEQERALNMANANAAHDRSQEDADHPLKHVDMKTTTPTEEDKVATKNITLESEIDDFLDTLCSQSKNALPKWLEENGYELSEGEIKFVRAKVEKIDKLSKKPSKAIARKLLDELKKARTDAKQPDRSETKEKGNQGQGTWTKVHTALSAAQKRVEKPIRDYQETLDESIKSANQRIGAGKEKIKQAKEIKQRVRAIDKELKEYETNSTAKNKSFQKLKELQDEKEQRQKKCRALRRSAKRNIEQGQRNRLNASMQKKAISTAERHVKNVDTWGSNFGASVGREAISLMNGTTEDMGQAAKNVAASTAQSHLKLGVKAVVYETTKEYITHQAPRLAKKVPGLNTCSYIWDAGCTLYNSKTWSGASVRGGLVAANIGINTFFMTVGQSLIPIPFVGAAVGSAVGTLVSTAYNHSVLSGLDENGVLPEELQADLESMNLQYVDPPFPREIHSAPAP